MSAFRQFIREAITRNAPKCCDCEHKIDHMCFWTNRPTEGESPACFGFIPQINGDVKIRVSINARREIYASRTEFCRNYADTTIAFYDTIEELVIDMTRKYYEGKLEHLFTSNTDGDSHE